MKCVVTGARGTVGSVLVAHLERAGHRVTAWDRSAVPIDDPGAMTAFVRDQAPDVIFHLAVASTPTGRDNEGWAVNCEWPVALAGIAAELDVTLVFTSTAMVFSNDAVGPFTVDAVPDADSGYGFEKRRAEALVRDRNPAARIVRLGWQIGDAPGSNNMIDFFAMNTRELGHVPASTAWYPATSFLPDTADALIDLVAATPGLYQLDSNRSWTFHEIASALSRHHGDAWNVVATDDFVYDQRLVDDRVTMPSLRDRLPDLPER